VKLSAEFLVLFVATLAVAGFVAAQMIPMITRQAQAADAMISGVSLFSSGRIILNMRNTGSFDITRVDVAVYPKGASSQQQPVGTVAWSTPISPGGERSFSGFLTSGGFGSPSLTAGAQYLVIVTTTFSGGATKTYPVLVVCLAG